MSDPGLNGSNEPRLALFIDIENLYLALWDTQHQFSMGELLRRARAWGQVIDARAYGDCRRLPLGIRRELAAHDVPCIDVPSLVGGEATKNAADMRITVDIIHYALHRSDLNILVVASGDSDFLPPLARAKSLGKDIGVISVDGSLNRQLAMLAGTKIAMLQGGPPLRSKAPAA